MNQLAGLRSPTVLDWGVRARLAMARDRADEALNALEQIPDEHELAGWAHLRAGQLALRGDRLRPAERELRRALELDPRQLEARRALIYILGMQLRRAELHVQYEALAAVSTLSARDLWVWCMLRDLVWWNPTENEPQLRRYLEADPEDRWSRLALAELVRRQGRHDEAALVLKPLANDDPEALAARAELALDRGDSEASRGLLDAGPVDHPSLARLRGRLALAEGDAASAVHQFEIALRAEPGRRRTVADLGRAWHVQGASDKAKPLLELAARIDALDNLLLKIEHADKTDPALWRRLADACEAAGRVSEARAWYALLLSRDPLDAGAQRAFHRLSTATAAGAGSAR